MTSTEELEMNAQTIDIVTRARINADAVQAWNDERVLRGRRPAVLARRTGYGRHAVGATRFSN